MNNSLLRRTVAWTATTLTICLLVTYSVIYVTLRNRGLREWKPYDTDGFLYDSTERVLRTHDMSIHEFRYRLFAPANYVDRNLFGGPHPIACLLMDID